MKALLGLIPLHWHKMTPEATDSRHLLLGEMREVIVKGTEVMHITIKLTRIGHILIGVVEIIEQHLTPIEKIIERLLRTADLAVTIVKHHQHLDAVSRTIGGEGGKQLTDSDYPW